MSKISRDNILYEGKAKILYKSADPDKIIQYFKDDTTAFNNVKKEVISGKGILNNRISEFIMQQLNLINIPTHFIEALNDREQLVKKVKIIPLEVVVRNIAAGSIVKRLDLEEGEVFADPLIELYFKDDKLNDPLISDAHVFALNLINQTELNYIKFLALRINDFLRGLFIAVGIKLVDFKIEFGKLAGDETKIILADEISPDSCRLWDAKTDKKLDKDVFRHDMGNIIDTYGIIAERLNLNINLNNK